MLNLNPINTGLFWAQQLCVSVTFLGALCVPPALKQEKPSPRVNNGNICCLKSKEYGNHKILVILSHFEADVSTFR